VGGWKDTQRIYMACPACGQKETRGCTQSDMWSWPSVPLPKLFTVGKVVPPHGYGTTEFEDVTCNRCGAKADVRSETYAG
jgi:hypothetical protein